MKKVILYGAGTLGNLVCNELKDKYDIIGFGDSNSERKGDFHCDRFIFGNIEDLSNIEFDVFIITSYLGKTQIIEQLIDNPHFFF